MNPFLQTDLFDRPAEPVKTLRPYQRAAIDGIEEKLAVYPSTLLVMATGMGKTVVAANAAMKARGRVLFCAHLDTLVSQSLAELQAMTGQPWEREQGEDRAARDGTCNVVASIASLHQRRITQFPPNAFDRVIVDEAHHYVAGEYLKSIKYFADGGAKIIGLTATPARKDKKSMGRLFASQAVDPPFDLAYGIDDAWLSPISLHTIPTDVDLDTVAISKVGKDFDREALDERILGVIASVVRVAMEHTGSMRTIVWTPGVKSAHGAAEAMNSLHPGSAMAIDGAMPVDTKRSAIKRHRDGEFQFLINCGVLIEGYDDARLLCMIDAAPTKSLPRCTQKAGRISRPWPGTCDFETSAERALAMAASPKPKALWIDLSYNGSKHDIMGAVDVLGGTYTDKERAYAKRSLAKPGSGGSVKDALRAARAAMAAIALRAKVRMEDKGRRDLKRVTAETKPEPPDPAGPPSAAQTRGLERFGVPVDGITHSEAQKALNREYMAKSRNWCNWREREAISRNIGGINPWGMTKPVAKLIVQHWRNLGRPARMTAEQIVTARGHARTEPGTDG